MTISHAVLDNKPGPSGERWALYHCTSRTAGKPSSHLAFSL